MIPIILVLIGAYLVTSGSNKPDLFEDGGTVDSKVSNKIDELSSYAIYKYKEAGLSEDVAVKNCSRFILLMSKNNENKKLAGMLNPDNKISREIFEHATGLKFGKTITQNKIAEYNGSFLVMYLKNYGLFAKGGIIDKSSFKQWFGDWETLAKAKAYKMPKSIYMRTFSGNEELVLFEVAQQANNSDNERRGIEKIVGKEFVEYALKLYPDVKIEDKFYPAVSRVVDDNGVPLKVYHGTNEKFKRFNVRYTAQGVFWFSSDKDKIERGDSGASGRSYIMEAYLKAYKIAGWDEYKKLGLGEIEELGYDAIKLDDDYIIFDAKQIKIVN